MSREESVRAKQAALYAVDLDAKPTANVSRRKIVSVVERAPGNDGTSPR